MADDDKRDPFEVHDPRFAAGFDALYAQTWGAGAIPTARADYRVLQESGAL
jgi:hypothetical protein